MAINLALLADIATAAALLGHNPLLAGKGDDVAKLFALAGLAFQQVGMIDADRKKLLEQIRRANETGGTLTEEEQAEWTARHEAAKSIIQGWNPGG